MKRRHLVGKILVVFALVLGVGMVWLYARLQPQFERGAEFEKRHSGGRFLRSWYFPAQETEVERAFLGKDSTTAFLAKTEFSIIANDARHAWEFGEPVSTAFLSTVCRLASFGKRPEDIARSDALLPGIGEVLFLLIIGLVLNSKSPLVRRLNSEQEAMPAP